MGGSELERAKSNTRTWANLSVRTRSHEHLYKVLYAHQNVHEQVNHLILHVVCVCVRARARVCVCTGE